MKNLVNYIKEAEGTNDGWNQDKLTELTEVLSNIYDMQYEIQSCTKGSYTDCTTYKELSNYIIDLAEDLKIAGEHIENIEEESENPEDNEKS